MKRILAIGWAYLLICLVPCQAQWLTQSFNLKSGWNAVYLEVDPSYDTLDNLVGSDISNPIQEVWMWVVNPAAAQFVTSPQLPTPSTQWASWVRVSSISSTLKRIPGGASCLVRTSTDFVWNLKGKPTLSQYQWTASGLNFIGFPAFPGTNTPSFDAFLSPAPALKLNANIFGYQGGPITSNPVQIFDKTATVVDRGQAYWVQADGFNSYFGPFEVALSGSSTLAFGSQTGQKTFRLRNHANQPITVTLSQIPSESAPTGQPVVVGAVPVLVKGTVDPATLTFGYTNLSSGPQSWTLAKAGDVGSEVEIVLGVDRPALVGNPGDHFASVLRFTDSLNLSQIDLGASAELGSNAGLWVGSATVTSVSQYLKAYAKVSTADQLNVLLTRLGLAEGTNGYHYQLEPNTGKVLVFGGTNNQTGSYLLDGPIKLDQGNVARSFPLRLIVHNDGTNTVLLQRVFYGLNASAQPILATREALLDPNQLANARRISAIHLPVSDANVPWTFAGAFQSGSNLVTQLTIAYDDHSSNPFLHTYHPDHDNLDAQFSATPLDKGIESYDLKRKITLSFTPPPADFDSHTRSGSTLNGTYVETMSFVGLGGQTNRQFDVRGNFVLNRISDIASLAH
jgi:hypothetical protein